MARTFHRKGRLDAMSEINVTPLIDLAFALLIIFMITAPLLEQTIPVNLPKETATPQITPEEPNMRNLTLNADLQIFWEGEAVTSEDLKIRLQELARMGDPPVIHLRADSDLPYQAVIDLIDLIKRNQLTRISLDTVAR